MKFSFYCTCGAAYRKGALGNNFVAPTSLWPPVLPAAWCGEHLTRDMYDIERQVPTPVGGPERREVQP